MNIIIFIYDILLVPKSEQTKHNKCGPLLSEEDACCLVTQLVRQLYRYTLTTDFAQLFRTTITTSRCCERDQSAG